MEVYSEILDTLPLRHEGIIRRQYRRIGIRGLMEILPYPRSRLRYLIQAMGLQEPMGIQELGKWSKRWRHRVDPKMEWSEAPMRADESPTPDEIRRRARQIRIENAIELRNQTESEVTR